MPAIVETVDGERVSVLTEDDVKDAKRFWLKLVVSVLLVLGIPMFVVANGKAEEVNDLQKSHIQDSVTVGSFPRLVERLTEDERTIAGLQRNLDSSIAISHQILRAVTHR